MGIKSQNNIPQMKISGSTINKNTNYGLISIMCFCCELIIDTLQQFTKRLYDDYDSRWTVFIINRVDLCSEVFLLPATVAAWDEKRIPGFAIIYFTFLYAQVRFFSY